jgi:xylulokinase
VTPASTELVVGVDIGTSSTKAVAVDPDGTIHARASRPHTSSMPRPGWVEQDAERDWWGGVVALCRELVATIDPDAVRGVCVSGTGPCLVPCDADGRPMRPAILYGVDSRAGGQIAALDAALGAERIVSRGGSRLSSQALGPKLLWLREIEPEVWARMRSWHMPSSFAAMRLCGTIALDHHSASQCDPFYDMAADDWARDWVADLLPGCPLPDLVWPGDLLGPVSAEAAAATGLPAGVPVFAGTIDAWAEALSVGVREPGEAMVMYGSTLFVIQVAARVRPAPPLWCTAGLEPDRPAYAAGMATSGTLLSWWRELMGSAEWPALLEEAAASPVGANGLVALPYFAGERTPVDDPLARGVLAGLTLRHTRGDVLRAAHEAIAIGVRGILELVRGAAGGPRRVVAVGGGLQGGLLAQIVSDACGMTQEVPQETIGASYGDALLAAIGAGLSPAGTDWTQIATSVRPDPAAADAYDALAAHAAELYRSTRPLVHRLSSQPSLEGSCPT